MPFDLQEIKQQVKEVISYSQDIYEPKVDNLIDNWMEAKRDIIELFGGELIYTVPEKISFTLSNKDKESKLNDFISQIIYSYSKLHLARFIEDNRDTFFENMVSKDYILEDGTVIPKGMKLLKAFKYFIESKDLLLRLQDMASMVIQSNKIEGYLCFSVHPLDYLSSSQTNYNWRSCHALDGEFRAGNLSYMDDRSTVVCYLRGDEEKVRLDGFPSSVPWNSKKWRMLLFLSDNWQILFAGRQYPFTSETALEEVKKNFISKFLEKGFRTYSNWTNKYLDEYNDGEKMYEFNHDFAFIQKNFVYLPDIIKNESDLHYNDLLQSSCYIPYYCYAETRFTAPIDRIKFRIGSRPRCLNCGYGEIYNSETMQCDNCYCDEDSYWCDNCGRRVYSDEVYWLDSGGVVCSTCCENICCSCSDCWEYDYIENMFYDDETDTFYCNCCYNHLLESRQKEESEEKDG